MNRYLPSSLSPSRLLVHAGLLALLVTSLPACETVVDVPLPDREPQLVASSFFTPDSLWEVHVSSSRSLQDESLTPDVENATVEIVEDGRVLATLTHTVKDAFPGNPFLDEERVFKGFYRAHDLKPLAGKRYTLRVSAPTFERLTAENHSPSPIAVLAHSLIDSVTTVQFAEHLPPLAVGEVRVTLADPAGVPNYYMVRLTTEEAGGAARFSLNRELQEAYYIEEFKEDPLDLTTRGDVPILGHIVFDDAYFEGQSFELNIRFLTEVLGSDGTEGRVQITVAAVTEDFFRYDRTLRLHNSVRENPFAEPVGIYSNIKNGQGIFAGYTTFFTQSAVQRGKSF